jgi:glycosyltransferase involved in cell wall biosynthesis
LGYRIVWTVHEVYPNDSLSRRIDRRAARAIARRSDVLLAHDQATAALIETELGVAMSRVAIVPHGSYAGFYPPGRRRAVVRSELAIPEDAFVFLAFGSLKPYKRLGLVLEAFAALELPQARLVVAGNVRDTEASIGESVLEAAEQDPRIVPLLELVPDERVAELFGAADVVVLSRSDGWTSGALVLALGQGRPVVVAHTPLYAELTQEGEAGWLFEPGNARSLRDALAAAASDPDLVRQKGIAAAQIDRRFSWEEAAVRTASLLRAVSGSRSEEGS